MGSPWDIIVLTSPHRNHRKVLFEEFRERQKLEQIHKDTRIIALEDPETAVGSGGATLNALLVATEYLSAQDGQTVVTPDTLIEASVLILHVGGPRVADPCGKAFFSFAAVHNDVACVHNNIDHILEYVTALQQNAAAGVWVCSTEMLLDATVPEVDWKRVKDVAVFACLASAAKAQQHGVYKLSTDHRVLDLVYQGDDATLEGCRLQSRPSDACFATVAGLVYLTPSTAEKLLTLHVIPPLDACTYIGLDNGADPLPLSLYLDVIKSALPDVDEAAFLHDANTAKSRARVTLRHHLRQLEVNVVILQDVTYNYMDSPFENLASLRSSACPARSSSSDTYTWDAHTHAVLPRETSPSAVVINSRLDADVRLGKDCCVVNTQLVKGSVVGDGASVLHVNLSQPMVVKPGVVVLGIRTKPATLSAQACQVLSVFGTKDQVSALLDDGATFLNQPFANFFAATKLRPEDLWKRQETRTLLSARLFPATNKMDDAIDLVSWLQDYANATDEQVDQWRFTPRMSLGECLEAVDLGGELEYRHATYDLVALEQLQAAFLEPAVDEHGSTKTALVMSGMTKLFARCAVRRNFDVFARLDHVAMTTTSPGIAAHALACIANALGAFSRGHGGLRSGPGRNVRFHDAYACFEKGDIPAGVRAMAKERQRWLKSPEDIVRAARHYESAAQILIRHAVMTAREFIRIDTAKPVGDDVWVVAEAPARVDLAGGWSDTPPIAYEHGGVVVNAAILIDGQRPIGAKCRRIAQHHLVLVLVGETDLRIEINELDDLRSYTQPQSPGALLKAAFCCVDLVSLDDERPLSQQLAEKHGCGFELHSWSRLPQGSGLGTSSILAGAVMSALSTAAGRAFDRNSLNHAVCHLEQLITTGGGWQDQVGGLLGGVKLTSSPKQLPLRVDANELQLAPEFVQRFSDHLVLIYTGKTRLARNLLQNVLRNWYDRVWFDPSVPAETRARSARASAIVENVDALTANAAACAEAFKREDLAAIGDCLNKYWEQKKLMAPGSEPTIVRRMMDVIEDDVYGQSLAGAGGGGFAYVISKQPHQSDVLEAKIRAALGEAVAEVKFHKVEVDAQGLTVTKVPV